MGPPNIHQVARKSAGLPSTRSIAADVKCASEEFWQLVETKHTIVQENLSSSSGEFNRTAAEAIDNESVRTIMLSPRLRTVSWLGPPRCGRTPWVSVDEDPAELGGVPLHGVGERIRCL